MRTSSTRETTEAMPKRATFKGVSMVNPVPMTGIWNVCIGAESTDSCRLIMSTPVFRGDDPERLDTPNRIQFVY
jgi:hypothetical protein